MVELKVNGTEYKETRRATEQTNIITDTRVEDEMSTNRPTSVLLRQREDQSINGDKNGETTGLLRYEGKAVKFSSFYLRNS